MIYINLTNNMRYYRLKNKYSIKQMADIINIDAGAISKMETGARHLPLHVIEAYCKEFGVSPNELFEYSCGSIKRTIPLYRIDTLSKKPVGFSKDKIKDINITAQEYQKGYSFAIQAWNMENSPKIYTGDLIFIKKDFKLLNNDVIFCLRDSVPIIRQYKNSNGRITLSSFSYYNPREFFDNDTFRSVTILGRVIEVRSFFRKGGNPWPNGR